MCHPNIWALAFSNRLGLEVDRQFQGKDIWTDQKFDIFSHIKCLQNKSILIFYSLESLQFAYGQSVV